MKGCWVFTLTYNSQDILTHFLHHYGSADRIIIYDNGSTDNTVYLAEAYPNVIVRNYSGRSSNSLNDQLHAEIKNDCWKEACGKADWVIIVDADEFLYHPQLNDKLAEYKRNEVTVPLTTAYEMVSAKMPEPPQYWTEAIKYGVRNDMYSKMVIFDPNHIIDIDYGPGGHDASPKGKVKFDGVVPLHSIPVPPYPPLILRHFCNTKNSREITTPNELKILHYRFVDKSRTERMWNGYKQRMSQLNMSKGWGRHYFLPVEEQNRIYGLLLSQAVQVIN